MNASIPLVDKPILWEPLLSRLKWEHCFAQDCLNQNQICFHVLSICNRHYNQILLSLSSSQPSLDILQHLEGQHSWFSCSHHRRTYCNVCRGVLHGVAWHGLSCEVCKMKSHRRCVSQLKDKCKWTTRSSLEQANVKIEHDVSKAILVRVLEYYFTMCIFHP